MNDAYFSDSSRLPAEILARIAQTLQAKPTDFSSFIPEKKGMTNTSLKFSCKNKRYLLRIPGEGTDLLIDRQQEYDVYQSLGEASLCNAPLYFDAKNGYKLTLYLDNVHTCNARDANETALCVRLLRRFHRARFQVKHTFDLYQKLEFYEKLRQPHPSVYPDYSQTKRRVLQLKQYIRSHKSDWTLTHMDAVPDNFLLSDAAEKIYLIDWEYAAMQDPHIDIAMFAIYALYTKPEIDRLIACYFDGSCPQAARRKIYCYIAIGGLLWSNWCEFKALRGITFDKYAAAQYEYAKTFSRIAAEK